MTLTSDVLFSQSGYSMNSFQKSAMEYLFSDPRLHLVSLNEQEYMEGQIAYRSQHNEQEMMLEATIKAVEKKMFSQEHYTIISIGCGSGLFEKPFLEELLWRKKTIEFIGIDTNEKECLKFQESCHQISQKYPGKFEFKIHNIDFLMFEDSRKFDIVLSIHSLVYIQQIEKSIQKIYEMTGEGGMAIVSMSPKRKIFNGPHYYIAQRLYGRTLYYDEDVEKVLTEFNIPFHHEKTEFLVNMTECFKQDSELGQSVLNFAIGAQSAYFSPLQLQLCLNYFDSCSEKMPGGEIMVPHFGILFYISK
jgi:SAM-dependent methyltransferase